MTGKNTGQECEAYLRDTLKGLHIWDPVTRDPEQRQIQKELAQELGIDVSPVREGSSDYGMWLDARIREFGLPLYGTKEYHREMELKRQSEVEWALRSIASPWTLAKEIDLYSKKVQLTRKNIEELLRDYGPLDSVEMEKKVALSWVQKTRSSALGMRDAIEDSQRKQIEDQERAPKDQRKLLRARRKRKGLLRVLLGRAGGTQKPGNRTIPELFDQVHRVLDQDDPDHEVVRRIRTYLQAFEKRLRAPLYILPFLEKLRSVKTQHEGSLLLDSYKDMPKFSLEEIYGRYKDMPVRFWWRGLKYWSDVLQEEIGCRLVSQDAVPDLQGRGRHLDLIRCWKESEIPADGELGFEHIELHSISQEHVERVLIGNDILEKFAVSARARAEALLVVDCLRTRGRVLASLAKYWHENIRPTLNLRRDSKGPLLFFPLMEGLAWDEVTIEFVSNESIRVSARKQSERFTFAEAGFKDRRKGDLPDSRWRVLLDLAENSQNELSDKHGRTKAAASTIRKRLRRLLQIKDGDPIPWDRSKGCYSLSFHLKDSRYGGGR